MSYPTHTNSPDRHILQIIRPAFLAPETRLFQIFFSPFSIDIKKLNIFEQHVPQNDEHKFLF